MSVTHAWTSPKVDTGDPTELGSTHWNEGHTVALSTGDIPNLSAVYDVAGLAAAAQAASDPSGTAAAAVAALSSVYQPLDSDLTAIAALSTTSYGRAFLALANAAAGITALGLGTAATQASSAFDAAGAAAAAQAASDPSGSATTALNSAKSYTDSSVGALVILTQAQVLARGLGA